MITIPFFPLDQVFFAAYRASKKNRRYVPAEVVRIFPKTGYIEIKVSTPHGSGFRRVKSIHVTKQLREP